VQTSLESVFARKHRAIRRRRAKWDGGVQAGNWSSPPVTHKNVVRIHDLGEINGVKYITMPYLNGSDLASVLKKEGKLPVRTALRNRS
jgi:serine/threonine protein kinase